MYDLLAIINSQKSNILKENPTRGVNMRRRLIIGVFVLILAITAVVSLRPNRQTGEQKISSINQSNVKEMQVRNLQQDRPKIKRVDMLSANNNLKMQLNSNPTIKIIDHNSQDKSHYYDKEVVVDFKVSPTKVAMIKITHDIDGVLKEKLDSTYIFKSFSKSPEELMQYFKQDPNVAFTEPHYIYLKNQINDTYYSKYQWNLPAIGTEEGWNVTRGSKKVKIAVVDTGVDLDHPDLSGRLTKGYNAIANNDQPEDDNGHGTHVAGIIASETNNGRGVAGITWYNPIIPVKVLDSKGSGGSFNVAKGIRWAVDHGANVINLSLGNYQSAAVTEEAIRYAQQKDVVIISAVGNDNSSQPSYPAAYPGVLGVAAVDWDGNRAAFSNYGNYIDVAAPGVEIASTFYKAQYATLSGTSMAAPHVTALAGLIRSVDPNLKNTEVMDIITRTTQKVRQTGSKPYYGSGIIDNVNALQYAYKRKYPNGGK
jgi:thermitase